MTSFTYTVAGAVDGTEVAIIQPSTVDPRFVDGSYYCHKGYHAINAAATMHLYGMPVSCVGLPREDYFNPESGYLVSWLAESHVFSFGIY